MNGTSVTSPEPTVISQTPKSEPESQPTTVINVTKAPQALVSNVPVTTINQPQIGRATTGGKSLQGGKTIQQAGKTVPPSTGKNMARKSSSSNGSNRESDSRHKKRKKRSDSSDSDSSSGSTSGSSSSEEESGDDDNGNGGDRMEVVNEEVEKPLKKKKSDTNNKKTPKAQQALEYILEKGVPRDSIRGLQRIVFDTAKISSINANSFEKFKETFKKKWGFDMPDGTFGVNTDSVEVISKQSLIDTEITKAMFGSIGKTPIYGWIVKENPLITTELTKSLMVKLPSEKFKDKLVNFVALWTYDVIKNIWKIQIKAQNTEIAGVITEEFNGFEIESTVCLQIGNSSEGLRKLFVFPK